MIFDHLQMQKYRVSTNTLWNRFCRFQKYSTFIWL